MRNEEKRMAEALIKVRTYVIVCALLVLLTGLTVGLSRCAMPASWHVVIGQAIAMCKASLVVLFFMHAIASPRLTWSVIAICCFWVGILFFLTLSDYLTRGLIPTAPGH